MIRAVGEFVLVKRDENPEQSEGGIHLLRTDEPATVVFPRYAGTEIHINKKCFLMLRTTEILATLEA